VRRRAQSVRCEQATIAACVLGEEAMTNTRPRQQQHIFYMRTQLISMQCERLASFTTRALPAPLSLVYKRIIVKKKGTVGNIWYTTASRDRDRYIYTIQAV
jgi:hypothetical protein